MKSPPLPASESQLATTSLVAASSAESTSPEEPFELSVSETVGLPWPRPFCATIPPADRERDDGRRAAALPGHVGAVGVGLVGFLGADLGGRCQVVPPSVDVMAQSPLT